MPQIIAHRGASAHAPENTIAAFRRAIDDGADGIEFDVRLTKDGQVVVFHDRKLKRTAGCEGQVVDLTLEELLLLDVGSWFDRAHPTLKGSFINEAVPTLRDTLAFLSDFSGKIYIELKCKEEDLEKLTVCVSEALNKCSIKDQIVVKSFKFGFIPLLKELCPGVLTAALFAPKIKNILRKEKHLVRIAEEAGADEISVHFSLATRKLLKKAKRRGIPVAIWTADNPRWVKRGFRLGLAAIITNDPARLIARRSELAHH
jgi:glycerophosphoryl diester phosphodiesterase